MPISASSGTDVQFDEASGGYRHHRHGRGGPAVPGRRRPRRSPHPGRRRRAPAQAWSDLCRLDVYNAEDVEKTLQAITTEVARQGLRVRAGPPARQPRSRDGDDRHRLHRRGRPARLCRADQHRGNTRTRDYVIRREFDLGEGDAYNKVLIDRGRAPPQQPRLLQERPHHQRAGLHARPRDRHRRRRGPAHRRSSRFRAAIRPRTASSAKSRSPNRNFLGRGQYVRVAGSYGQYSRASSSRSPSPTSWLPDGGGLRPVLEIQRQHALLPLREPDDRRQLRLGLPLTDEVSTSLLRYSLYQQDIKIPNTLKQPYNDCWYRSRLHADATPIGTIPQPPIRFATMAKPRSRIKEAQGKTHHLARRLHAHLQHPRQHRRTRAPASTPR